MAGEKGDISLEAPERNYSALDAICRWRVSPARGERTGSPSVACRGRSRLPPPPGALLRPALCCGASGQGFLQAGRIRVSLVGLLCQALEDHGIQLDRDVDTVLRNWPRRFV